MTNRDEFKPVFDDAIADASRIMITAHHGPDDDSISSVTSLYLYLVNHTDHTLDAVDIVYEAEPSDRWESFEAYETIEFVDDLTAATTGYDCFIFLDGNEPSRFTEAGRPLGADGTTICIDHHPAEEYHFDLNWVEEDRAATADMIYDLCFSDKTVSTEEAEHILLGIVGDTGMFRYVDPSNASVFRTAEALVRQGDIQMERFGAKTGGVKQANFEVFQRLMANAVVGDIDGWPAFLYSYVDESEVREFSDEERSSGAHMFVSWTKRLEDVNWGFVYTPRSNGKVATSFRSAPGSVNVQDVAERLGIGGGHVRAAGGRFEDITAEEAIEATKRWMRENQPVVE
jgi:phosphoesterase RecJ-like protein